MKNAALPAAAVRIRAEARRSDLPDYGEQRQTGEESHPHYKGTAGIFSDNYFDLLPGESRSVTLTAPEDAAEILRHIECMALNPEITIIKL
ncbi:MAG: glycoside hydrolase family 2 protein [Alistipes onderdonkii]